MSKKQYNHIQETLYQEKLDNGLTVFLLPRPQMSKTYAIFSTNYGSIDRTFVPIGETDKITVPDGIAHFLEHKLFEKEDRDVFADFGKQGASANAYTSFTKTAYLFSATTNIEENVKTLLDFVQDPYFSEKSVEKEKGIIGQEIKMYDDQPDWQSFMGTLKGLFKETPVNIDIAGTVESISKITKDDLYTCYHTFYHPENMVFLWQVILILNKCCK
ncbi:EF-P 5-aminopentanol modification-associated protein YfmH [Ornithinibacillus scapharcae]|uniref:EF-P 5-aminopentanol modification-associated protein YfmH n=1 Tax=Ornithinibacillus scapharcae TaxID=1147159 RepID=UPI000225B51E